MSGWLLVTRNVISARLSSTGTATEKTAGREHDAVGGRATNFDELNGCAASVTSLYGLAEPVDDHSAAKQSRTCWLPQFSDHLARFHLQQQQQNGGETSLTELRPVHAAAAESASAVAAASNLGGGYPQAPPASTFTSFPSYYSGGDYAATPVVTSSTSSPARASYLWHAPFGLGDVIGGTTKSRSHCPSHLN